MLRRTSDRQGTAQRVDDNRTTVLKRIEGYFAETVPVVEYFRAQGKLIEVYYSLKLESLRFVEAKTLNS